MVQPAAWVSHLTLYVSVSVCCVCRCVELKAGYCILGIQALAEMDQWLGVLAWILQQYEQPEKIPVRIMQMWSVQLLNA